MPWLRDEGFSTVINLRAATEEGVDLEGCRAAAEAAKADKAEKAAKADKARSTRCGI